MASGKLNVSIYYDSFYEHGFISYPSPISNAKILIEFYLNEIENIYNNKSQKDFIECIDKISRNSEIKDHKNNAKIAFGVIEHYSKHKTDSLIKHELQTNHQVIGQMVFSKNKQFFMTFGKKDDAEKLLIEVTKTINRKIKNFYIKINDIFYGIKPNFVNNDLNNINNNNETLTVNNMASSNEFYNKIIFGPTGTGKSTLCDTYIKDNNIQNEDLFRITFFDEYSYYDFFGQYKPIVLRSADKFINISKIDGDLKIPEHIITYQFVPGIFFNALLKAKDNQSKNNEKVVLLIEEINRGNCSSIFGDILQLLDRDNNGDSSYKLSLSSDLKRYLIDMQLDIKYDKRTVPNGITEQNAYSVIDNIIKEGKFSIPSNLIIIGTMNTSDQSLFPIDSAFKRRWDMQYCHINYKENSLKTITLENTNILWVDILKKINEKILEKTKSEDKQIGQWFIKPVNNLITENDFKNKVISYLFFDVFKHLPDIFKENSYSSLIQKNMSDILKSFD